MNELESLLENFKYFLLTTCTHSHDLHLFDFNVFVLFHFTLYFYFLIEKDEKYGMGNCSKYGPNLTPFA